MKPRLVVVGGFLGSGKTTLLLRIGERLSHEYGKRVIMITNDQGEVLVDSLTVKDYGSETAEAIRDAVRELLSEYELARLDRGPAIATITVIFSRDVKGLDREAYEA